MELFGLNFGLGGIPLLSDAQTRSISAENPTGERAGGAKAVPDEHSAAAMLGKGWKVRPCITLPPKSTTTLAEIEGRGSSFGRFLLQRTRYEIQSKFTSYLRQSLRWVQ